MGVIKMPIIEEMEPFTGYTVHDLAYQERAKRLGMAPTMYRLNYMGQKIEGLKKQDLINIMNAIYHNQKYLR